jgi:hypothetical protein
MTIISSKKKKIIKNYTKRETLINIIEHLQLVIVLKSIGIQLMDMKAKIWMTKVEGC